MDDLHFDTLEAALTCAKSLRTWGAFMDENANRQVKYDLWDEEGGMCALGAAFKSLGQDRYYECVSAEAECTVAEITRRQVQLHDINVVSIPYLNDFEDVTFPQFATACRTLAAMIEERFVLPSPTPATVDAFVMAEAN